MIYFWVKKTIYREGTSLDSNHAKMSLQMYNHKTKFIYEVAKKFQDIQTACFKLQIKETKS